MPGGSFNRLPYKLHRNKTERGRSGIWQKQTPQIGRNKLLVMLIAENISLLQTLP